MLFFEIRTISITYVKTIIPLFLVFILGFFGFLINDYAFSFVVKDITYFLKPIIALSLGYFVFKKNNDLHLFIKTISFLGVLTASIHVVSVFFFSNFFKASIHDIRGDYGLDNFIEVFVLFFLIFGKKALSKDVFTRNYDRFFIVLLTVSIFLYFSRTMFVAVIILGIVMTGYARLTPKAIVNIGIALFGILIFYSYLYSIKLNRNSSGLEGLMYKVKIAPEEIFKSKVDRDDHKKLWDHWRAYEAKRAFALMEDTNGSYVLGTGYGSLIDLKFKAPLGDTDMRYISRIHNGYVFVLYKTGLVGFLLMLIWLIYLYRRVYDTNSQAHLLFIKRAIGAIGIYYFFTTLIITGIYIPRDAVVFILGGLISFENFNRLDNHIPVEKQ